jgi:hypothetical protein
MRVGKFTFDFTKQFEEEARLGPRGYGRKRVADALAEVEDALKDVSDPAIVGYDPDEPPSLLRELERAADPDQYDGAIPRDSDARHALEELASAIGIAFALGKYVAGDPSGVEAMREEMQRRTLKYREGQQKATANKKPREWIAVARNMIDADKRQTSHDTITDNICKRLKTLGLSRARRTVYNEVLARRKLPG